MAAAEIVGFAVAWLLVAVALAWTILVRGGPARLRRAPRRRDAFIDLRRLTPPPTEAGDSWVTVETIEGVGADVVVVGEVLVSAAMAARGFDPSSLSAADVRIETSSDIDGSQVTRFLVHSRALSGRSGS